MNKKKDPTAYIFIVYGLFLAIINTLPLLDEDLTWNPKTDILFIVGGISIFFIGIYFRYKDKKNSKESK
ncbi:hypothetical protein SFC55_24645 [Niallia taxi]|uniref:hypothetical protein n=1 Tax=Niallia taxi TaxID=2499688 RepID=UPI00398297EF